MQTHIKLENKSNIAYLKLSPEKEGKPPTLDYLVLDELAAQIAKIRDMEGVRAVVICSASDKYFCVGANINELMNLDEESIIPWVERGHTVFNEIANLPLPVIACVRGYALGGGLELAMACDLIIASNNARFGQPEANLGLVTGWGGSFRLPQRVGPGQAKYMLFTGHILDADESLRIGLVDDLIQSENFDADFETFLTSMVNLSAFAIAQHKQLVNRSFEIELVDSCSEEVKASKLCLMNSDTKKRIFNFLESRKKK